MESSTKIILLRHGECEGGNIFRGTTDVSLLPLGSQKMLQTVNALPDTIDAVVSSPMLRCRAFAEAFSAENQKPFDIDDKWQEMSFGDWEGQEIESVQQNHYEAFSSWLSNPVQNKPPNSEDFPSIISRIEQALNNIFIQNAGKTTLVVAHGGVIRVALCLFAKLPIESLRTWHVDYGSASCLARYTWSFFKNHKTYDDKNIKAHENAIHSTSNAFVSDKIMYHNWLPVIRQALD